MATYEYVKPHNIRRDSGWSSFHGANELYWQLRERLNQSIAFANYQGIEAPSDSRELEIIKDDVISSLKGGFAVPNGAIAWSTLFSELTDEQFLRLRALRKEIDGRAVFGKRAKAVDDMERADLVLFALNLSNGLWRSDLAQFGEAVWFCQSLPLVDVGTTEKADYRCLAYACSKLLLAQVDDAPDDRESSWARYWPKLARPKLLRSHIHEYIDRLVVLNNEVQRYCAYARGVADDRYVELAHKIADSLTDDEIGSIAAAPPAVLFTAALGGGVSSVTCMPQVRWHAPQNAACPV